MATQSTKRLQKIRQDNLKHKAAAMLGKRFSQIQKVIEHPNGSYDVGATVRMKSGRIEWINIPTPVWIGEMTEEEYTQARLAARKPRR
jgi:hypothetical protein